MASHHAKYIVVLKDECHPGDDVSFDGWSFEDACAVASALNTGAVQEAEKQVDVERKVADSCGVRLFADVWFGKPEDYRFTFGFGIKKVKEFSL